MSCMPLSSLVLLINIVIDCTYFIVIDCVYCSILYIQVYTSGKGSSAAGLTASVTRDPVSVSIGRYSPTLLCQLLEILYR